MRDDLLQTAVALDVLALCYPPGPYLPRPAIDTAEGFPWSMELRSDASDVAELLVRHDLRHNTSSTGTIPTPLEDGCSDRERDAVRAYVRAEWHASQHG
ncbi:hypothetical protein ACQB60_44765 [Actinomycetota bacterium Odt1-20B]